MRITLIQLSDIHFIEGKNWIADKSERIASAAWSDDPSTAAYVLVVAGDIAYSGKEAEYANAHHFVSELHRALRSGRTEPTLITTFVPGNHDCDFDRETDTRRMALNHLAAELPTLDPQGDIVRQCLAVQDPFYSFLMAQSRAPALSTADRLLQVKEYDLEGFV